MLNTNYSVIAWTHYDGRKLALIESEEKNIVYAVYISSGHNADYLSVWPTFGVVDSDYPAVANRLKSFYKTFFGREYNMCEGWIFKLHRDYNDICSYWRSETLMKICHNLQTRLQLRHETLDECTCISYNVFMILYAEMLLNRMFAPNALMSYYEQRKIQK